MLEINVLMGRRTATKVIASVVGSVLALSPLAGCISPGPEGLESTSEVDNQRLKDLIYGLGHRHLTEISSREIGDTLYQCAKILIRDTSLDVHPSKLVQLTNIYNTHEAYLNGVGLATNGEYNFSYTPKNRLPSAITAFGTHQSVHVDLSEIDYDLNGEVYSGIGLFSVVHEFMHVLEKIRKSGNFLKSYDYFTNDNDENEPWIAYRGGVIITQTLYNFHLFNEAWTQYVCEKPILDALKDDPILSAEIVKYISHNGYVIGTKMFSDVVDLIHNYELVTPGTSKPLDFKQVAQMHVTSDVEQMFIRMGRIFTNDALELLEDFDKGTRTDEEVIRDRDVVLGKKVARVISRQDQATLSQMLAYLKMTN